jgi:hypothetical protein
VSTVQEILHGHACTQDIAPQSRGVEQRKYARFPVSFPTSFGDGVSMQTGTVVDISPEGCRIRCADATPGKPYFEVEIWLDGPADRLVVELAVMRWARGGEFGVEFIRMEPDHQARLRTVIRSCEEACSRTTFTRSIRMEAAATLAARRPEVE